MISANRRPDLERFTKTRLLLLAMLSLAVFVFAGCGHASFTVSRAARLVFLRAADCLEG